jgi:hypothetical protein
MDDADLDDLEDVDDDDDDKAPKEESTDQKTELVVDKKELAKVGVDDSRDQNGKNGMSSEKELEENKTAEDMDHN